MLSKHLFILSVEKNRFSASNFRFARKNPAAEFLTVRAAEHLTVRVETPSLSEKAARAVSMNNGQL